MYMPEPTTQETIDSMPQEAIDDATRRGERMAEDLAEAVYAEDNAARSIFDAYETAAFHDRIAKILASYRR